MDDFKSLHIDFSSGFSLDYSGRSKPVVIPESFALGKYWAVVNALRTYAEQRNLLMKDKETANVYAENCKRKIQNFAHGHERTITLFDQEQKEIAFLRGRLEAFNYADYSNYGDIELQFRSLDPSLLEQMTQAANSFPPVSLEEINDLRGLHTGDKVKCYGYCKRD